MRHITSYPAGKRKKKKKKEKKRKKEKEKKTFLTDNRHITIGYVTKN